MHERDVTWEGFFNARDLGGLPTHDGRRTRPGAVVRSAGPWLVTEAGWQAAHRAGFRTIIDLRESDELAASGVTAPAEFDRAHTALDDLSDTAFWQTVPRGWNATPLYYPRFLAHKPRQCAAAVTEVARARPGGVIFHCASGRDRTGLLTLLLLSLAGVPPEIIADDHQLSRQRTPALAAALGRADETPEVEQILAAHGTTGHAAMLAALDGFDAAKYLLAAGVTSDDLATIRTRLLG